MKNGMKAFLAFVVGAGVVLLFWWFRVPQRPQGGDDQPPVTVGDGSVLLHTDGVWDPKGNPQHPSYYDSYLSTATSIANAFDVSVPGSTDPKCPPDFVVDSLKLVGGNGTTTSDWYTMDFDGNSGIAKVSPGQSNGVLSFGNQVLELTYPNTTEWWLKELTGGSYDCVFPRKNAFEARIKPIHR